MSPRELQTDEETNDSQLNLSYNALYFYKSTPALLKRFRYSLTVKLGK